MANILECGTAIKVKLIGAMPRESFADIAATFTRSEKDMEEIVSMPYNEGLVKRVVNMSHLATTEFDYFVFAVEGCSRVTEIQLVRKRLASYLIKSGRVQKNGRRSYDVIKPKSLNGFSAPIKLNPEKMLINSDKNMQEILGENVLLEINLSFDDLMDILEQWYGKGVEAGLPEEDLRYTKPQGTEWKGLIGMNGHALLDWFKIRCCKNAQHEIQKLALEMLKQAKKHSPALFANAGASCKVLGYCPENGYQHKDCKGKVMTHDDVKILIKEHMKVEREKTKADK